MMKQISTVILAVSLLVSSTAFAKHYVIVNDFYGPTLVKTHKVHYFAGPGYYYTTKVRPVYYDAWGRPFIVSHKHYVVQQPVASFHFSF
jgi:hypothetical protein